MAYNSPRIVRRHFLQSSIAAAAGFACPARADAIDNNRLIDTHVYVGHWPLKRLSADTPAKLAAALRRDGVTLAWVGSFDGLFHKDIHGANLRLVEACRDDGDEMPTPIGAVNPTLPDWKEDLRRCHESFNMHGIRLHPAYHGYALDDPRFAQLLDLAAARGLFVQLVAELTDKRHRHLTPANRVDFSPLSKIVPRVRGLRIVISNPLRLVDDALHGLAAQSNTYFDIAPNSAAPALRQFIDRVSADRIVYGSSTPLPDVSANRDTLFSSGMTAEQIKAIRSGNAERIVMRR